MSFIEDLGNQVGGGLANAGVSYIDEMLMGNRRRKKQIEQQQKLTDMQKKANLDMTDYQAKKQLEMWKSTNFSAQMEEMRKAGLNPAMIYGSGGSVGDMGGGVAGTIGADTSDSPSEMKQAESAMMGMGIQRAMMGAQTRKLEAEAKKIESEAGLTKEKIETESKSRNLLIENLRQEGVSKWFDNLRKEVEHGNKMQENEAMLFRNSNLNVSTGFAKGSMWEEQITTAIAKTLADTGRAEAGAILDSEKAKGYWQELVNATKKADSDEIKAAAIKLAVEFETGEYTNWMTWAKLAIQGVNTVANAVGSVSKGVGQIMKEVTK